MLVLVNIRPSTVKCFECFEHAYELNLIFYVNRLTFPQREVKRTVLETKPVLNKNGFGLS